MTPTFDGKPNLSRKGCCSQWVKSETMVWRLQIWTSLSSTVSATSHQTSIEIVYLVLLNPPWGNNDRVSKLAEVGWGSWPLGQLKKLLSGSANFLSMKSSWFTRSTMVSLSDSTWTFCTTKNQQLAALPIINFDAKVTFKGSFIYIYIYIPAD